MGQVAPDARRQQAIRTLLVLALLRRFHDPVLTRQMLVGGQFDRVSRRLVVQWVAESGQKEFRPEVASILDDSEEDLVHSPEPFDLVVFEVSPETAHRNSTRL